jgi:hypothetical protein
MKKAWLLGLLVCVACGQTDGSDSETVGGSDPDPAGSAGARTGPRDSVRDEWVEEAFSHGGAGLDGFVASFGEPDSVVARPQPNVHDTTQIDTVITVVYNDGLRAWIYRIAGGRDLLVAAEVSSNRYLLRRDVEIGMSWAEVQDALGPPLGEIGGTPYYDSARRMGADEPVYIELEGDTVRSIRFERYTG